MKDTLLQFLYRIKPKRIRTQFLIWFLLISFIPFFILFVFVQPKVTKSIKENAIKNFEAMAYFQVQKIEHFRDHLIDDMNRIADEREIVEPLVLQSLEAQNSERSHTVKQQFKAFYQNLLYEGSDYYISDFLLISSAGQILYSVNDNLIEQFITDLPDGDLYLSEYYLEFLQQKTMFISGTTFDTAEETPAFVIFMPVFHRGEFIGSYAKVVNLTRILSDMASKDLLGKTGEMLVGQRLGDSVVFISPLRFSSVDACRYKVPLGAKKALPIQEAAQGKSGNSISIDYRGEKVIADWQFISGLDWGIVTKMDQDELFIMVNDMRIQLTYVILLIIVITASLAALFSYTIAAPIINLKLALNKAGEGDLSLQLQNQQKDEIGDLYRAFNEMINNLRTITISRNRLNEEVEARKKVEEQVNLLSKAVKNSPTVIIITNKRGIITYVNNKFEELTGYDKEEAIGKNPRFLSSGLQPKSFYKEMWSTLLEKGFWRGQIRDKNKEGELFWQDVSMSTIHDDKGEISHFVSAQINISDKVEMQEELVKNAKVLENARKAAVSLMQDAHQQQEKTQKALLKLEKSQKELQKLSLAIEQSPITVFITDNRGRIEYVNPYFTVATGYTFDEVKGQEGLINLENHNAKLFDNLWSTIKSGSTWRGELQSKKKNGEHYWESATISPIFSDDTQITNYIAIKEDITIKKALEENATKNRLRLLRYQNALNNIAQGNIFINPDFNLAIQELNEQAAIGLDVDRASLWLFTDKKKNKLRVIDLYLKDEGKHIADMVLEEEDYPLYFKAIKNQKVIAVNNAREDARTREFTKNYLNPLNIYSMIDVSVTIDGEVLGVVCHEATEKTHEWSIEEENFARSISDFVALIISNNNRREVQSKLENFTQLQRLVSSLASSFIYIPLQKLDEEIENSLMLLVKNMQMDGAIITRLSNEQSPVIKVSHHWLGEAFQLFENQLSNFDTDKHSFKIDVENKEYTLFSCPKSAKNKNKRENDLLYTMGVRSGISLPIKNDSGIVFAKLYFFSTQLKIILSPNEINLLSSLSTILENAFLRKEKEEELIKAKENAEAATLSKSVFLANMSHEIRTPLNAVLGFSEILSRMIKQPNQVDYLNSIRSSGKTLLSLINDILDFSKIEAGKLSLQNDVVSLVNLFSEINQAFELKTIQKGLDFKISIPKEFPKYIYIDELRLKQVILNLLSNAVKFTDTGFVRVLIKIEQQNKQSIDFEIQVKDSGIGMSDGFKNRVFEAFEQQEGQDNRKYGGTGLGLAITSRIIKMMGGKIRIQSNLNKGSRFRIQLKNIAIADRPLIEKPSENRISPDRLVFSSPKVMVVDDVLENRKLIEGYLLPYTVQIQEAENGLEAIEKIKNDLPDFIFMDTRMPVMDGKEAVEIIKSNPEIAHIPVVALTASTFGTTEEEMKILGFDAYVRKPASLQDIVEVMMRFLSHSIRPEEKTEKQDSSLLTIKLSPELFRKTEEKILPLLLELQKIRPKKKVMHLVETILTLGEKYNNESLISCGQELRLASVNFNVEREKELLLMLTKLLKNKQ